ncbi:hypothetical protein ACRAWF_10150 [Streptomyces sp. L7]
MLKARALAQANGPSVRSPTTPAGASTSSAAAPGIFSARWVGRHGDDKANLDLLLAQLSDIAGRPPGRPLRLRARALPSPGRPGTGGRGSAEGTS